MQFFLLEVEIKHILKYERKMLLGIVIFLSISRHIHGNYHKSGHDIFLPCLYPFTIHESSIHDARYSQLL